MSSARKLCRAVAVALAAALPGALPAALSATPDARADTLDLSMPRAVIVGAPRGAAPSERFDPRPHRPRPHPPPGVPVELWRRHVSGNIDVTPVIDGADAVIVALTIPEIVKLGPDARELWRARLGNGAALAPPAILSDGTIAVIAGAPTAAARHRRRGLGLQPRAAACASARRSPSPGATPTPRPLALADGGLLIAAGNVLVEIDADGAVRARATSTSAPRAPSSTPRVGALVTTVAGNVYRFRPPAPPPPDRVVRRHHPPRAAVLADDRTLLAVVDGRRLVALDLPTGTSHVRAGGLALDGPPTVGAGLVFLGTQLGMLLGVDAAGNERVHVCSTRWRPRLPAPRERWPPPSCRPTSSRAHPWWSTPPGASASCAATGAPASSRRRAASRSPPKGRSARLPSRCCRGRSAQC